MEAPPGPQWVRRTKAPIACGSCLLTLEKQRDTQTEIAERGGLYTSGSVGGKKGRSSLYMLQILRDKRFLCVRVYVCECSSWWVCNMRTCVSGRRRLQCPHVDREQIEVRDKRTSSKRAEMNCCGSSLQDTANMAAGDPAPPPPLLRPYIQVPRESRLGQEIGESDQRPGRAKYADRSGGRIPFPFPWPPPPSKVAVSCRDWKALELFPRKRRPEAWTCIRT